MRIKCFLLAIVLALTLTYTVSSASLVFDNQFYISGVAVPGDLTMTFTTVSPGTVILSVNYEAPDNLASAFVSGIYFNFKTPTGVILTLIEGTQDSDLSKNISAINISDSKSYKADGDGSFNVQLDFPTSGGINSARRFNDGETYLFSLTGSGITESTFFELNSSSLWYTAAHIQGLTIPGQSGTTSTWVGTPVPIPAAAWLLGTGLVGLVIIRRRMKK